MAPWLTIVALAAAAQAQSSLSMLRFGCAQTVIDRIDPLVDPGKIPSPHVHQVVGGNAFNASMPTSDISKLAKCTSCTFSEDFSNYWTAAIYFKARNGTYKRIPQMPNQQIGDSNGGLTVYYTASGKGSSTAFKPGFRMFSGNANRRVSAGLGKNMQSCYRCFGPNFQGNTMSPCMDPKVDSEGFPKTPCPGGIRSSVIFPLCWDGKNLDSPNHIDHVAHPESGPASFAVTSAKCPASHPVKIPQVHLEIVWDTRNFASKADWPEDSTKQPLVLSSGDETGFGQHGDYVFGWEGDSLQRAMDNSCFGPTCAAGKLKTQAFSAANKCTLKSSVKEDYDGWVKQLPGMEGMNMPM